MTHLVQPDLGQAHAKKHKGDFLAHGTPQQTYNFLMDERRDPSLFTVSIFKGSSRVSMMPGDVWLEIVAYRHTNEIRG